MEKHGFALNNLMELAGLSVAHSIYHANKKYHSSQLKKILVLVGPGSKIPLFIFKRKIKLF